MPHTRLQLEAADPGTVLRGATALAGPVRVERRRSGSGNQEIDAATRAYVDFENAVSVASMLLLTEATLTELPEPRKGAVAVRVGKRVVVTTGSPTGTDPAATTFVGCCVE